MLVKRFTLVLGPVGSIKQNLCRKYNYTIKYNNLTSYLVEKSTLNAAANENV